MQNVFVADFMQLYGTVHTCESVQVITQLSNFVVVVLVLRLLLRHDFMNQKMQTEH